VTQSPTPPSPSRPRPARRPPPENRPAGEQATGAHARAKRPHRRVLSLDSVRGILLLVNIAVISVLPPVHPQLKHAAWFGVTFFDVVFPLFVTFSGVGLAFAHRNHVTWRRTFRRSGLLLLIGLAYTVVVSGNLDPAQLRFTGPLQVYAILVLVIGALHLVVRRAPVWAAVTVVVAAVHAFLLGAWQAGCPGGQLAETCNPSRVVDVALLGSTTSTGRACEATTQRASSPAPAPWSRRWWASLPGTSCSPIVAPGGHPR
jgi:heparan-alpha-glucosaminide N-acetyltransferase